MRSFTFFIFLLITTAFFSQACFKQPVYYPASLQPYCIQTCDINNDNKPDLVSVSPQEKTVSLYLGTGQGLFSSPVQYTVGGSPYSVVCRDFNADGKTDLAMAVVPQSAIVWFGNGNGTFSQSLILYTGYCPVSIISGDFNGDNKPDLATANCQGAGLPVGDISVFLNTGNTTFAAGTQYTTSGSPYFVSSGDLNSDGNDDIISSQPLADKISAFIATATGSFFPATTYTVTDQPCRMQVGDFNNDLKTDVVVTNYYSSNVALLSGDGQGNLSQPNYIPANPAPSDLVCGNFDADNISDMMIANYYVTYGTISFLKGLGAGNYAPPVSFTLSTSAQTLIKGDFNSDGLQDIASANYLHDYTQNNISVLLNYPFNFNMQASATIICAGDSVSINISGANTYTWSNNYINGSWVTPTISSIFFASATNSLGCVSQQSIGINVFVQPSVTVSSSASLVCAGTPVTLYSMGANAYQWSTNCNSNLCSVIPTVSSTYTVIGINGPCPTDTKTIHISVNPSPPIQVSSNAYTVCEGQIPVLSATGAQTYTWTSTSMTSSTGTLTNYTVYGTDSNSCVGAQSFSVLTANCIGLEEIDTPEHFVIYPHPVRNTLYIKGFGQQIINKVELYDLNGRCLLNFKNPEKNSVCLEGLCRGMYIIQITTHESISRQKILKE